MMIAIAAGLFTGCEKVSESIKTLTPDSKSSTNITASQVATSDLTGRFVINPQFDWAGDFSEGLAAVRVGDVKTGKVGFIDKQGKFVINPQFDWAGEFSESLAAVRVGDNKTGKWGFIDKQGRFAINPQFVFALN